jgi:DNA-binding CsgD family transcriptional regulator
VEPSTRIRRASREEAHAIWRELVSGHWSIVDRFDDGNGRRIVLVELTNEAASRPWHRLSAREKMIVAAVANGRSNREIAADLAISVSTVAGYLRSARKKLGGARRIDLVREWRSAAQADSRPDR